MIDYTILVRQGEIFSADYYSLRKKILDKTLQQYYNHFADPIKKIHKYESYIEFQKTHFSIIS